MSDPLATHDLSLPPAAEVAVSETDNAIAAHDLRKVYKATGAQPSKEALKGIELQVPRGSIFGLLGPNGAGKSTFINILAGLVVKTAGQVTIWGFDIDVNPRQARASIGVVPQELSIDPFFTPEEVLELQAGLYGVPRRRRRTMEILRTVNLADQAQAYARTLSGGMRRRLLVAKAMVHNPPILVLDEPTAGVDVDLRRQLWEHVRRINEQGATIILTTHYLEEAQALCDRIAIVDRGGVVVCESTQNLLQRVDRKTLVVTPASPVAVPLPRALSDLDAELDANGRLVIRYRSRSTHVGKLLARLGDAGIEISDLSTREADLEDVFLRLTHRREAQVSD